ncbi:Patatin-like protein 7 [Abeliophyllum distichum]|uniref:Patatin n=1 Tax=Abeliophyllum distichum TaxID=126358 RepID=A0ABD1VCV1_9LAMI
MTAAVSTTSMLQFESSMDVDKLTYEIFSILENKFLFGYEDDPKFSVTKEHQGNPNAHVADFFDVVAGAGVGGILAGLLFTRGKDGEPMFGAEQALKFIVENCRKFSQKSPGGVFQRVFRPSKAEKVLKKVFGELTLKDTLKPVLIPCYDLSTGAPFLFSRADALEMDGCDFKIEGVCGATITNKAVDLKSIDGRTKILAVGGGVAMNNPTAAAITHVLNNKQEFPLCKGVEDLLVVSLANGESDAGVGSIMSTPAAFVRIAGDGAADMVDQAVSMAFGESRRNNYIRIQGNGIVSEKQIKNNKENRNMLMIAEEMLAQKNVESVLFSGKKLVEKTNLEKLEMIGGELIKEEERRKKSIVPTVVLKVQGGSPSPRSSSATTLSTLSSMSVLG